METSISKFITHLGLCVPFPVECLFSQHFKMKIMTKTSKISPYNHSFITKWASVFRWHCCSFLSFSLSARTWANWPQCRWVTITRGSMQSGWWSAFWSATRLPGTHTSERHLRDFYLLCWSCGFWKRLTKSVCCAGFRVADGWGKASMMAVWRGFWWESWWPPAQRMMKGCVGHPRCSSPQGWWGGLLPSRQTANQVSYSNAYA